MKGWNPMASGYTPDGGDRLPQAPKGGTGERRCERTISVADDGTIIIRPALIEVSTASVNGDPETSANVVPHEDLVEFLSLVMTAVGYCAGKDMAPLLRDLAAALHTPTDSAVPNPEGAA